MKKIVYIIDGLGIGGAERVVAQLATAFANKKYVVQVIAVPRVNFLDSTDNARRGFFDELVGAGISVTVLPKQKQFSLRFFYRLYQLLKSIRPDIVHTHLYTADTFGTFAAWCARVPVIVSTEHNKNIDEGVCKAQVKNFFHRMRTDIACVSHAVREYVQRSSKYAQHFTLPVMYNSVDIERFSALSEQRKNNSIPVMTIVGRLVPQKGHERFLGIFAKIDLPVHLRIVGSGPLEQDIRECIAHLHLADRVTLEPARMDIECVYAESDIVVVPSLWEGFGIVAVEAQAAGCPVIVSAVDGLTEVVQDGKTGYCVDMNDAARVEEVLKMLVNNQSLREELGVAGRAYIQSNFTEQSMVARYEQWYESL